MHDVIPFILNIAQIAVNLVCLLPKIHGKSSGSTLL